MRGAVIYSRDDLLAIVRAGGADPASADLRQLEDDLSSASLEFQLRQSYEGMRSVAARGAALTKVELNAAQLLRAILRDNVTSYSPEAVDGDFLTLLQLQAGSHARVLDALAAVEQLRSWANVALQELSSPPGDRHKGSTAEGWLIAVELPRIYEQHFRPFTISTRRRAPGGHGVDFVMACAKPLGIKTAPAAIKKLRQRHKSELRAGT
jgi:hypothetical protein